MVPDCILYCASTYTQAISYAQKAAVDIAFVDINIPGSNGLILAKQIKEMHGTANIIFVTGYPEYALEAFTLRASGYLMKPITAADIEREIRELRYPVDDPASGVRIQTFGNFELYVDGQPIHFRRSKSKEIVAYLVDRRGASVSKRELATVLWEDGTYDRTRQSHLQTLVSEMMRALKEARADHIIIKYHNHLSLDTRCVSCDYYDFINWDSRAVNAYQGEYMANYSWAEFTAGELNRRK